MSKEKPITIPELTVLGTPEDILYAQQLFPNQQVYACLPVSKSLSDGTWAGCAVVSALTACIGAICMLPFSLNKADYYRAMRYIVTEDAIYFHTKEYTSTFEQIFEITKQNRHIPLDAISKVVVSRMGRECMGCNTPFVDVITQRDNYINTDYGKEREENALYIQDLSALADLLRSLIKNAQSKSAGEQNTAKTVYVSVKSEPQTFKAIKLSNNESWKTFMKKIEREFDLVYVNKVTLVTEGLSVPLKDLAAVRSGDKLIAA